MSIAWYLSHPQVTVDPVVAVPQWGLSSAGRTRLQALAGQAWLASIKRVVASDERKAIETAELLQPSTQSGEVEVMAGFHENDRSATGFLPPDEFEAVANEFFAHPRQSIRGWERAVDAQARIVSAVTALLADHQETDPILIVGHGGVGTLLKCWLKNEPISRLHDQAAEGGHPGGGNVHSFSIPALSHLCGWVAMEQVTS